MKIEVTRVDGRGGVRRGVLDTAERSDADRYRSLVEQAALDVPPPYQPAAGEPVYQIRAEDKVVLVSEEKLAGPLRDLVTAVLTDRGEPAGSRGEAVDSRGEAAGSRGEAAGSRGEAAGSRGEA